MSKIGMLVRVFIKIDNICVLVSWSSCKNIETVSYFIYGHYNDFTEHTIKDIKEEIVQERQRVDKLDEQVNSIGIKALLRKAVQGTGMMILYTMKHCRN